MTRNSRRGPITPLVAFWQRLDQPELGNAIVLLRERFGISRGRLITRMWDLSDEPDLGVDEVLVFRWEKGDKRGHFTRPGRRYRELLGRVCERELKKLNPVARHEFLKELAALDVPTLMTESSNTNAVLGMTAADVSPVTAHLEYLRNRISGANLIHPVRTHIDFIAQYLSQAALGTDSRAQLVSALGEVSVLAGALSLWDLNDEASARHHFLLAGAAAREAEDNALRAFVLGFMAELEAYLYRPARALELTQAAQEAAGEIASPRLRSWLAAVEAQAKARTGQMDILPSLERAREEMSQAQPDDPDPQWIRFFDPARLEGYEANTMVWAGRARFALQTLRQAAAETSPFLKNYLAEIAANTALVLAQEGEIDESCQHLATAFDLARSLNYGYGLRQIDHVRQQLGPWSGTPAVRDLDERLTQ
jgi:hypothetical protein